MSEIMKFDAARLPQNYDDALRVIGSMADMLRVMAERMDGMAADMAAMRTELSRMRTITPTQIAAVNAAIKTQAQTLTKDYRLPQTAEKALAAAIRREMRSVIGVRAVREIPISKYKTVLDLIDMYEDWDTIKHLRGH